MEEPKLKPQLKLLATYYCGEAMGNAEKAAVMAGYSPKYARGNAYKLVARKDVQEYIKYINHLKNSGNIYGHIMTIQEIQVFWTDIINNGAVEPKDRLRASENLAKALGAFNNEW